MVDAVGEIIAKIKDRLDILEVVSEKVILKKSGSHYWGCCPFHKEKTPSFSVNPSLGIYKCFGCGEGGDAISFIMKTEGKSFMEVIRDLAEKFGYELPASGGGTSAGMREFKEQMLKASAKAADYYTTYLLQDKSNETLKAMNYLAERGITKDIIQEYNIGLASSKYTALYDILRAKFSDEVLEKAGLIMQSRETGFIDRFRNRIIIPIRNEHGDFVAFGARAIMPDQSPKYLNSSDSLIYNKSKILYGLYHAKEAIKEENAVILMEGYFDVISAQAHGVKNCVASCGTSLTAEHIKLLSRYTPARRIYLSFDTDSAGQKATSRNAELIKEAFTGLGAIKQFDENYLSMSDDKYSCEIRVIAPPEGKDPDEFIRSVGADSYREYIKHAPLLLDFQIECILKERKDVKTPLEKSELVKRVIPYLQEINNQIVQGEYVKTVAGVLDIDEKFLLSEVRKKSRTQQGSTADVSRIVTKNITPAQKAQKNLLSVFLVTDNPLNFKQVNEKLPDTAFTDETLKIVKSTIDKLICTVNNVKELIEELYTSFIDNPEIHKLITEMISISETFSGLEVEDVEALIDENLATIQKAQNDEKRKQIRQSYINANDDDVKALMLQMQLRDQIK
ncbi:MAG: DNA primase [Fusobacterium sp.]|nr:DNA primase [Fusobacterium sp.]